MEQAIMFADRRMNLLPPSTASLVAPSWQDETLCQSLSCWQLLDHTYRFVLSVDGKLTASEERRLLSSELARDFKIERSRLMPIRRQWVNAFNTLLTGNGQIRTMLLPRSAEEGHWVCRAADLSDCSEGPIGLSIQIGGSGERHEWADLSSAFGLTPTEQIVLNAFLCGESPRSISQKWKSSVNTVRTHLRHIHEKLDVRDHHDLWRKMIGYRIS